MIRQLVSCSEWQAGRYMRISESFIITLQPPVNIHRWDLIFYSLAFVFCAPLGSGSQRSLATSASIDSGEVVEAQRWTTLPSRSIKNFSKFHWM